MIYCIQWLIFLFIDLPMSHIILRAVMFFACLFPVRQPIFTRVKRLGKMYATLGRDRLPRCFAWCDTPDNATDEWWYGMYSDDDWLAKRWTQSDYDNSRLIRYYCRVRWLWRNCGYGFAERVLGRPVEDETVTERGVEDSGNWSKFTKREHSFQYEAQFNIGFGRYNSLNIGWKSHKGSNRLAFAGRLLGIRKYQ